MNPRRSDVTVIGAGPAGLCAALRLQQLGYHVILLERSKPWPRPQIGEALTPGVRNIIDLLDANQALEHVPLTARLPTRIRWDTPQAEDVAHGDSAVVERASFDAALLELAQRRGIEVMRPAHLLACQGQAGHWQLEVVHDGEPDSIDTRFVIEAGGRGNAANHLGCAPALAATWAEWRCDDLSPGVRGTTRVEALETGWLWGTRLPDHTYRVMLLGDPAAQRQTPGKLERRLHAACAVSTLFGELAALPAQTQIRVCDARPYLDIAAWQPGWLKTGDAAFAIDPISSSGVEKAMRFSLQAVTAAHTFLQSNEAVRQALAGEFFEERLLETCARHLGWTRSYYARAWCAREQFWQDRSAAPGGNAGSEDGTRASWRTRLEHKATEPDNILMPPNATPPPPLHQAIRFASTVETITALCVVQDQVHRLPALVHPSLARPLSFYEDQALLPCLDILRRQPACEDVLRLLGSSMSREKAQRLLAWLWQLGVIESVPV